MISWTDLLTENLFSSHNLRYSVNNGYVPKVVVWNITSICNLNCRHCYSSATNIKNPNELNKQEAEDFIEDLSQLKVPALLFSGGEPLLRQDIFALAKFAKEKGIKVALSTNGTLITAQVAKKIKEAGFYYVGISLDGMQKTHNTFRRSEDAFQKSIMAMRNCQDIGLKVGIRFTLTKYNFRDLPDIFNIVEDEAISRFCIYHLVYTGRGIQEFDLSFPEKRQVLELIWQKTLDFFRKNLNTEILTVDNHTDGVWIYLKLKRRDSQHADRVLEILKAQGGNSSGINIAAVGNCGDIYADQFLRRYPIGNIRQKRFSDIWRDECNHLLHALRNRRLFLKGRCQRCDFLHICNGNLRSRAEAVFGDPWQEDPACYLTEEEIKDGTAFSILGDQSSL